MQQVSQCTIILIFCAYLNCYNKTSIERYNMHFYSVYKQYLAFYVKLIPYSQENRRLSVICSSIDKVDQLRINELIDICIPMPYSQNFSQILYILQIIFVNLNCGRYVC